MSPVETREKSIRLASSRVAVTYPSTLDPWLDGVVEPRAVTTDPSKWVRLCPRATAGRFDVVSAGNDFASDLDLGAALATFFERVSFLLLDELDEALALHAAALRHGDSFVLLPGRTGSGKTHLALWYRAQGFDLGTDEIVTASPGPAGEPILSGALGRPLILKRPVEATALLRPGETPVAQQDAACGRLIKPDAGAAWTQASIARGLIVFPRFTAGAAFSLTPLTPGMSGLRLLETCLNVRNLPRGGLPLASLLARRLPAIALEYGDTGQLEGTLDVLTRQLLGAPPGPRDLAALCAAFTALARIEAERRPVGRPEHAPDEDSNVHAGARSALAEGALAAGGAEMKDSASASTGTPRRPMPAPTAARFPRRLTIGMATYDDYDGVYFTVQSIRINNPELDGAVEFVVVDNNPGGRGSEALDRLGKSIDGYRYVPFGEWSGTAIRNAVFEEASSPFVLCIDSHVLIVPGALSKLISYFEADPDSRDLVQGPLVYDDLRRTATHLEPRWRGGMYGCWANDPRGADPTAPGFDIPMQGMGVFACRRTAWARFNPRFRGFGGEEGYIHEKMRQRGGRTLCVPFLRWVHRFDRPGGAPYPNRWEDRIRNYLIGFTELGLDTGDMEAHFAAHLGAETSARIFAEIKRELDIG